jgi:hypothetical protein
MLERQVDSYDVTKWNYATVGVQLSWVGYLIGATIGYQKKIKRKIFY